MWVRARARKELNGMKSTVVVQLALVVLKPKPQTLTMKKWINSSSYSKKACVPPLQPIKIDVHYSDFCAAASGTKDDNDTLKKKKKADAPGGKIQPSKKPATASK
jgi:hypothetical protein